MRVRGRKGATARADSDTASLLPGMAAPLPTRPDLESDPRARAPRHRSLRMDLRLSFVTLARLARAPAASYLSVK